MLGLIAVLLVLILFTLAQHRDNSRLINPGNIIMDEYNTEVLHVVALEDGISSMNIRFNKKRTVWFKTKHIYPVLKTVESKEVDLSFADNKKM